MTYPMVSKSIIIGIVIIAVIAIFFAVNFSATPSTGNYDNFTKCLSDSGAKMYGTYGCKHCQNQKNMFGSSLKYLDYVECSLSDGSQASACSSAGVRVYPTWIFGSGTKVEGELTFQKLSEYSGCKLS